MDAITEKVTLTQYNFKIMGLGPQSNSQITGVMLNELALSGSNQFSTSGEMVRNGTGGLSGIGERVGAKVEDVVNNKVVGRQMGGYGRFNKGETRAKWTESTKPQFNVDFIMLANTAADAQSNMGIIQLIKSGVLPINDSGALLAPLGYRGSTKGTLTFALGTWLVAPKLVMINESCMPSRQVMSNGYPLTWHCTITMEPYETITIDDFKSWFQQPAVLNPAVQASNKNATTGIAGVLSTLQNDANSLLKKYGVG